MLIRFVYLDKKVLAGYAAQLDGGLIAETKVALVKGRSFGGQINVKFLGGKAERTSQDQRELTLTYPPEAQFQRLLAVASAEPETLNWVEVLDPNTSFASVQVSEIIAWECTLQVDEASRLAARGGGGTQLLKMFEGLLTAQSTGMLGGAGSMALTPEQAAKAQQMQWQLQAAKKLLEGLNVERVVVGRDSETEWSIYGSLQEDNLESEDIDNDRLIVVGKVKRVIPKGGTRRLVNTESIGLMETIARQTGKGVSVDETKNQIVGPALELDILAIYR